jgi:glutamine---fructose-6-phosphate transaminase (isomerizing)
MSISPLIGPTSPLDERQKLLLAEVIQASSDRAKTLPTDEPKDQKRFARVQLTKEEMVRQTEAIRETLDNEQRTFANIAAGLSPININRVYMVGCGDSLFSMVGVRALWESLIGIPVEPIQALDFAYYYSGLVNEETLVITLSSSGKTPRTLEALLLARSKGAKTVALTNTLGTPMMNEADFSLYLHAERKGWPTQSSSAAMAALYQLAFEISKQQRANRDLVDRYEKEMNRVIDLINPTLQANETLMETIAGEEVSKDNYLFAGGGPAFACASFGAAKTKELTPSHAIAIPLEEYHHYRSQKVDDPLFLIAPKGPSVGRAVDTAHKGLKVGGKIYAVITEGDDSFDADVSRRINLPEISEYFVPILYTLPLQQFAYYLAIEKFKDAGLE